ncbi:BsuBI/PstI family type II restriction endonuclease [Aquisphaera insulae]|uniref:BsuBI/PstI family type II restriction endonuclease n=1 Tax=Aquisphaera insulae TaxID=2712864 RepID=UPI0013ED8914|nr:BsuBI/PstI family type II restriction endonuclease [Aquisphaera insulae]
MSKVDEAVEILVALGLPRKQQNERSALTLLALAGLGPDDPWSKVQRPSLRIWDIMAFMREHYGKDYAANSRETIRRQTIHQFEQARLVDRNPDDPSRPTNSGRTVYILTEGASKVLRTYNRSAFKAAVQHFTRQHGALKLAYHKSRETNQIPLRLPDASTVLLSPGKHNLLQVAVIEVFGPRFAAGAEILYLGDTARKHVIFEAELLAALGVPITDHDKLPDVILHDPSRRWLFLIEAVTSHGPVTPKRYIELESLLSRCPAGRVYVTAFLSVGDFRKYAADIAWETEVWIADSPDHMIHFDGSKFLGPYVKDSE